MILTKHSFFTLSYESYFFNVPYESVQCIFKQKISAPSFSIGISAFAMAPSPSEIRGGAYLTDIEASSDLSYNERTEEKTQALVDSLHLDIESVKLEDPAEPSQVVVNVQGKAPFEFLEEEESFQQTLAGGGSNASAAVDKWARNRLNKFRLFKKLDETVPLEDLPAAECSSLLTNFFEQVTKKDGALYPNQTLMGCIGLSTESCVESKNFKLSSHIRTRQHSV